MTTTLGPSRAQVAATSAVVRWYVATHFGSSDDAGVTMMFCDPQRVGSFAVTPEAIAAGDGAALFKLLVTTAMFQRRQDVQILRILRGIKRRDALELTSARRLLRLVDRAGCEHAASNEALQGACDLSKDPTTRIGCCSANPMVSCHMKRHTVLLKRYGHFGKVPTSLALLLRDAKVQDLSALREAVLLGVTDPLERARALEAALSRAWRVNQKIASMFLSMVTNPDLSPGMTPWRDGLDWTYYVVVDSNVDLFLESIGYRGGKSYDHRREFVRELARRIDLSELDARLQPFNPRVVQQALYLFMSAANRRAARQDCMHAGADECGRCERSLRRRCPVARVGERAATRARRKK